MAKDKSKKSVEAFKHDEAKRRNIPTAEHESVMFDEQKSPIRVAYERRNRDLDPQLVWRGKDEQDWSDLVVQAPPLYIQEKVHPKVLIDDLLRRTEKTERAKEAEDAPLLFADLYEAFNGLDEAAKTDFYKHDQNWSNRMILGDSLQVMASLAEREGLRGQVQCIYIDPPYGIKFNSNFQWSTTDKSGASNDAAEKISREPEQVKAFRDTWRDGIHSYLTYLRDRLTVARDLLTESGSIFVQIGDENVHRVRALLDEAFGDGNFVGMIYFQTAANQNTNRIQRLYDIILWYGRGNSVKFREVFRSREQNEIDSVFTAIDPFTGDAYKPAQIKSPDQVDRLRIAGRLAPGGTSWMRFMSDFPFVRYDNVWKGTVESTFSKDKIYVVQTNKVVVERCFLMATDPGDLVLDPTCGSGTSAFVAEKWGRRWITIDTSRVALALARARIMGARYPYYLLADSPEGQQKEGEITETVPSSQPTHGNLRHGFVYERVPHITLKSIANNTEIDVIWEKWQQTLEPLREQINKALGKNWQEWEIPRGFTGGEAGVNERANQLLKDWWDARINRQKEIDASIAAKADSEYLYDKPYPDNKKVRVAGPFTVESLSPHRTLGVGADDELLKPNSNGSSSARVADGQDFASIILENLKTAGVQQAHKEDKIVFTSGPTGWPGYFVCAEARYDDESGFSKRAAIFIGPEFGTVSRADLVAAAREAGDAGFDVLIACAFNYDARSTEFNSLGRIPVLKARMNADLHMADDLKNTGKGNLFVIFGEPDIDIIDAPDRQIQIKVKGVDVFDPKSGEVRSDGADGIACWFIDTDYNEESFFVRHAYFLGQNDPYKSLKTSLKAEINEEAWGTLNSDISRPFNKPESGRVAVKVINHLGDEVMKVFRV